MWQSDACQKKIKFHEKKIKLFQYFQYFDYILFFLYQGHGRSGEVPNHHHRVLQRCYGKGQRTEKMCTLRVTLKLSHYLIGLVRANLVFSEQYTAMVRDGELNINVHFKVTLKFSSN